MNLESGDYFREASDFDMQAAVFRLQNYAQSLRNKLEMEKVWLASLRSDTQLLLAQKGAPFPEGYHLPQCPMSKQSSSISLAAQSRTPSHSQFVMPVAEQKKTTCSVQSNMPYYQLGSPFYDNMNNIPQTDYAHLSNSKLHNLNEKHNYFKKLVYLDTMCKQEMARVSQVSYDLEPLKQLASDWDFQAEIEKPKPSVKDLINKAIAENDDENFTKNSRLFVQSSCDRSQVEDIKSIVFPQNYFPTQPKHFGNAYEGGEILSCDNPRTYYQDDKAHVKENETCKEMQKKVIRLDKDPLEKTVNPKKSILKKTASPQKEIVKVSDKEVHSTTKTNLSKLDNDHSSSVIKNVNKDTLPKHERKSEVAPIVWGRLAVDKKKKSLKPPDLSTSVSKPLNDPPCDDFRSSSNEDDANSVENHFTTAVECAFLRKYMYSDSDYIYSPLFVSESEES